MLVQKKLREIILWSFEAMDPNLEYMDLSVREELCGDPYSRFNFEHF